MPHVHFVLLDGSTQTLAARAGDTVMNLAITQAVPGIEGICGGCCSCATCHVYVDEAWADRLPPVSEDEADLLEGTAAERLPTSRLSCQIKLTDALDGLVVRMPATQ